ncbi:ricin B lectin (PTP6b) [Vairimorpha necatrix]|uniref:Ricin B lectin (PTP6b) n=1 Tax=Vairimorpha necatrix TaxID=6039 RepID=A0AAX4J7Z8_9MICR
MILFYFGLSFQVYIKSFYYDVYMCDRSIGESGRLVTPCSKRHAKKFVLNFDGYGYTNIKLGSGEEYVVEADSKDNTLKYVWKNDDDRQVFQFLMLNPHTCKIRSKYGCVTYDDEDDKFVLSSCIEDQKQIFSISNHKDKKHNGVLKKNTGFPIYGDSESTYGVNYDSSEEFNQKSKVLSKNKKF